MCIFAVLLSDIATLSYKLCLCVTVNWLDHSKTFREQGIDKEETLLLRRKFFFSDQNVDARDPVQLNLLYVQVSQYKSSCPYTY